MASKKNVLNSAMITKNMSLKPASVKGELPYAIFKKNFKKLLERKCKVKLRDDIGGTELKFLLHIVNSCTRSNINKSYFFEVTKESELVHKHQLRELGRNCI